MRVSVRYMGPGKSLETWFDGLLKKHSEGVADLVEDAVERGEQITKHNIETRGTLKSGKRGRVITGTMRDAVDSEVTERSRDRVRGKFGWIKDFEDYFGYQELGFEHRGGVSVDGMYALSDAAEEVFADVEEDIDRIIRDS